ncbi:uncharacterized protein LOC110822113 [Carica papaya]|uniref:uncharacterized protein LOC110822113 n=1 Tax=Carica papaya TaxID=3649 RepID=UPI000B8CC107|nr:uncharacterized protein LOC110822113 [Carica papaya]
MGNAVSPCWKRTGCCGRRSVKLVFWGGTTRVIHGKHIAGEIMFESPDKIVCHADSFFIGHPIPALSLDDELLPGQTYFVLPIDRFACSVLTASSLAGLSSSGPKPAAPIKFGDSPFQYLKGSNGRILIKVAPEFIARLINAGEEEDEAGGSGSNSPSFLCSTPELKKHYEQLVGSKEQVWSPKLETISEHKIRFSPCRFIGLEWKQKEKEG